MRRCVCPGSFDPVTLGHIDVIERATRLFDEVLVAILGNPSKTAMFSVGTRVEMMQETTQHLGNVRVEPFDGLLVELCRTRDVAAIVKGVRTSSDFSYEIQMAHMNAHLGEVETIFLAADPAYSFVSSSLVKEVVAHGGNVDSLVPEAVIRRLPPPD